MLSSVKPLHLVACIELVPRPRQFETYLILTPAGGRGGAANVLHAGLPAPPRRRTVLCVQRHLQADLRIDQHRAGPHTNSGGQPFARACAADDSDSSESRELGSSRSREGLWGWEATDAIDQKGPSFCFIPRCFRFSPFPWCPWRMPREWRKLATGATSAER